MSGLWVDAVVLWVQDTERAAAFYRDGLGLAAQGSAFRLPDGLRLILCPGRVACSVRGPHGLVPALEVNDIVAARAHLRRLGRPVVFEEVVPGLARVTFIDPDGNAIDLVQPLEVEKWQRGARIPEGDAERHPPQVRGLFELSVYARDTARMLRFYRDILGLDTGLAYFAHIHLLFENVPLVIRPTWYNCNEQSRHTPALLVRKHANGMEHPPNLLSICEDPLSGQFDGEHTWVLVSHDNAH